MSPESFVLFDLQQVMYHFNSSTSLLEMVSYELLT